jgi:hypothetical protein
MMWKQFGMGLVVWLLLLLAASCTDHGLEPVTEGISGRITYVGTWPDSTDWVRLAVFKKLPANALDILQNPPVFSDPLPLFVNTYDYTLIPLDPGTYEWVVLAWKPKMKFAATDFSGLDTLAMFADPNNPRVPRAIQVHRGQLLTGIDIVADFSNLLPPSPILP